MITQLTLGVRLREEATFDNYCVGKNQELVEHLKQIVDIQGDKNTYFWGVEGAGRTHLLQACCHAANTRQLSCVYIPFADYLQLSPNILEGLESLAVVCVDDIHHIAGNAVWEEAFFHLYNRIYHTNTRFIMTAKAAPKALKMQLPDLISRLTACTVFHLQTLTDEEKSVALRMRAEERGLALSEEAAQFLLNHFPRHMPTLFEVLNVLDRASLRAQRKLTIPFIKTVLNMGVLSE